MKIRNWTNKYITGILCSIAMLQSCADDTYQIDGLHDKGITFEVETTSGSQDESTRAYINHDNGTRWNAGNQIMILPGKLEYAGLFLPFSATQSSDGLKSGIFQWSGDPADELDSYYINALKESTYFYAIYPKLINTRASDLNNQKRYITYTQYQVGESSKHLSQYLIMASGKIDVPGKLPAEENGTVTLPSFKMHHKTAIFRFLVANRQNNPLKISSVSINAKKKNGESNSIFKEGMEVNLETTTWKPIVVGSTSNNYTVNLSKPGESSYGLSPNEDVYVYCATIPVSTANSNFIFTVKDSNGAAYNSLELNGDIIPNKAFEEGKCYTFHLNIDHTLKIQGWEEAGIDNVNLGQRSLCVSEDSVRLPLEGGSSSVIVTTSDEYGWTIEKKPEWVSVSSMSGASGSSQITFTVGPSEERKGEVCITAGNIHKYLTIHQSNSTDDTDAVIVTSADMKDPGKTSYILQDNELPDVYFNKNQRSFYTTEPLQLNVTNEQKLHFRFYSPRKLSDVQIWACIPETSSEEFLLAELEEIAPFADFKVQLPFIHKDCTFKTASGRRLTVNKNPSFQSSKLKVRATSSCDYWQKLQQIKVKWRVGFEYYDNKDKDEKFRADHRMRPAHCREMVALALNNCYMFSTDEYRDKLYSLQGAFYSDNNKVNIINNTKLYNNQICKERTLWTGLTTTAGRSVINGTMFTFLESAFLTHYADDTSADKLNLYVFWHELAHIIGYNHDGNMTFPYQGDIGWSQWTAEQYYNMSKEKKLPVYSRRFMHTRDTPGSTLYSNKWKVNEWYSFGTTPESDPALYEIDKGILWYIQ